MERSRGILSSADRAFLEADEHERKKNYSQPARSQRWSTIRERTYHGLRDGEYLLWRLPAEEREAIFSRWQAAGEPIDEDDIDVLGWVPNEWDPDAEAERDRLRRGLVGLLGFIYQGAEEGDVAPFEELLERAIGTAEATADRQVVDVDLEVTYRSVLDTEELLERFQAGDVLRQYELAHLASEGVVDGDDLEDYYSTPRLDDLARFLQGDEEAREMFEKESAAEDVDKE